MIKVENAQLKFDRRGIAGLHGIHLQLKRGEIFALMGPNGCGKSTFLNALSGKHKLDQGSVKTGGRIHQFKLRDLPHEENVQKYLITQIDPDIDDEKKIQLTRDFADLFEFTFQLRQRCGDLSQGQRQKVMLTAELINHPEILLLDEPFVHLDPMTRRDILQSLFTYVKHRELTVLWVTHEKEEAMRFSDSMAVMQHGKFEQQGKPEAFLRPSNLFVAQFMGHQNFLPVKKFNGKWQTPWGEFVFTFEGIEAVLVIPHDAWKAEDSSKTGFKVLGHYPQPFHWEVLLEWESRRYTAWLENPPASSQIKLSPDFSQCFLIPL
jgi:ABC-type Fe3+/spermidine/putrescine transport system ATPase subunit